jgi:hypothetical protein
MANPRERVEAATDHLTEHEHARKHARHDDIRQDVHEAVREQREEINGSWAAPGMGPMTDGQWKGFLVGALGGGLIGLLLLLPFGLLGWGGEVPLWGRLLIAAIAGALAGGTVGVVYLGGRVPELEGETVDAAGRPDIGSSPRDRSTDARGRQAS